MRASVSGLLVVRDKVSSWPPYLFNIYMNAVMKEVKMGMGVEFTNVIGKWEVEESCGCT